MGLVRRGYLSISGKIRSFGVSNFDVEDLEEGWAITDGRIVDPCG
jgi:diketogulonate reductase-like aldo/keto reductase